MLFRSMLEQALELCAWLQKPTLIAIAKGAATATLMTVARVEPLGLAWVPVTAVDLPAAAIGAAAAPGFSALARTEPDWLRLSSSGVGSRAAALFVSRC